MGSKAAGYAALRAISTPVAQGILIMPFVAAVDLAAKPSAKKADRAMSVLTNALYQECPPRQITSALHRTILVKDAGAKFSGAAEQWRDDIPSSGQPIPVSEADSVLFVRVTTVALVAVDGEPGLDPDLALTYDWQAELRAVADGRKIWSFSSQERHSHQDELLDWAENDAARFRAGLQEISEEIGVSLGNRFVETGRNE